MNSTIKLVLAVVMTAGLAFSACAEVIVGEAAPNFTAQDTNGKSQSLSDYKGKYVVLEWFNHDCPFIKKHYNSGNMQKLQKDYTQKGVIWLSLCSSAPDKQGNYSAEELNQMAQAKGASPTAIIRDADGAIGRLYGAQTTPHLFVINPDGNLIYQGAIDDKPTTDATDIVTSKNYVAAALDAAMSGNPIETSATKSYGCSVKY